MHTSHDLQADIDELRQKKKVLSDRLKPWAAEALKLSQDVDVAVRQLNQTLESVTATMKSQILQNLVDIAQNVAAQSECMLPPLAKAIRLLQVQVETPPSE